MGRGAAQRQACLGLALQYLPVGRNLPAVAEQHLPIYGRTGPDFRGFVKKTLAKMRGAGDSGFRGRHFCRKRPWGITLTPRWGSIRGSLRPGRAVSKREP